MDREESLLALIDDELLAEYILRRISDTKNVTLVCKRLCRLVRYNVPIVHLQEESCAEIASLPPWNTYTGCRGVFCYVQDTDNPLLPRLSAALDYLARCWPRVSEMAIVAMKPAYAFNPAVRQANDAILAQIRHLRAISSLRHLQLYKTAPLIDDAVHLARLTQLTSLILADSSYIPGPEAMLAVDLGPLSNMTNLVSLCVAGICPAKPWPGSLAGTGSSSSAGCGLGCLPASLTALVLKQYDDLALRMWLPHLEPLTGLRVLHLDDYQEPSNSAAYQSFPVPYLEFAAEKLPGLHDLLAGIDGRDELGRRLPSDVCGLPLSMSSLQQLTVLEFLWCQATIDTTAQWNMLCSFTALKSLRGLHLACAPPVIDALPFQMPGLTQLCIQAAELWAEGRGLDLHGKFPKLAEFAVGAENSRQLLSIAPCIAECTGLTYLSISVSYTADIESIEALKGLGDSLKGLKGLNLTWSGGIARWPLPDLSTFTHIQRLHLTLRKRSQLTHMLGGYNPDALGDAQVLAYLAPLSQIDTLLLWGFTAITPAVLLGLQALIPQLRMCVLVRCNQELMSDEGADWEGSDIQVVRAALRKNITLEVLYDVKHFERTYQLLPSESKYVDYYKYRF